MTLTASEPTTRRAALSGERAPAPAPDGADPSSLRAELDAILDNTKWAKRRASKQQLRLRDMPIVAFVGKNGHGKSATAVMATLGALRGQRWHCEEPSHLHNDPVYDEQGNPVACGPNAVHEGWRLVYSTVELTVPGGGPHPLFRRLTEWHQVRDAEHAIILLDEVTGIANSRDSMSLPRAVQTKLDQLRKADVQMIITSPSFQRMDNTLRTVATAVVLCRGYFPEPRPKDTVAVSAWRRLRLFRCRVFDANEFEEFHLQQARTDGKNRKNRIRAKFVFFWWGPGSEVFPSYSSRGAVSRIGQASDSGACLDCGGTRTRPKCTCKH